MSMLADIASGNTGTADLFFLIAVILAFLAVVLYLWVEAQRPYWSVLISGAVGCLAMGMLLL